MTKKASVITNLCIAAVLIGLGVAVFTADLSEVFISVGAPVYNGDRAGGKVSLMFIAENDATAIDRISAMLKSTNTPATFFVGGKWVSDNREKVISLGKDFELGNHAYNNRSLADLKEAEQSAEIKNCHAMVMTVTGATQITDGGGDLQGGDIGTSKGVEMKLFLPPNGSFSKKTLRCAEQLGYNTVMWSKDATANVYNSATQGVLGGDLILLKADLATLSVLNNILNYYRVNGLQVVTAGSNIV